MATIALRDRDRGALSTNTPAQERVWWWTRCWASWSSS